MMKRHHVWKIGLLSLVFIAGGLGVFPRNAAADVPVWVTHFDQCTDYQKTLERSIANIVFGAEAKLELFLQDFTLGQIEKAREDVAKLVYETEQELKEEALLSEWRKMTCETTDPDTGLCIAGAKNEFERILRTRGLIRRGPPDDAVCPGGYMMTYDGNANPVTGGGPTVTKTECVLIKKEGRVITNPDEYLYEEPIEKARHYAQCYLAPWRYFPFANDTAQCESLGLTGSACTGRAVCEKLRQDGKQCESDQMRDRLKFEMLNKVQRKDRYIFRNTNPPESWYTPLRCEYMLSFLPSPKCVNGQCPKDPELLNPPLDARDQPYIERQTQRTQWYRYKEGEPDLDTQPAYNAESIAWGHLDQSLDWKNTFAGVAQKVSENMEQIISEYQELRKAEFIAGQGIRAEKYLIGWTNRNRGKACDKAKPLYGRVLEGCGPDDAFEGFFYFSTEDIIAPAVVLLQKMQSATQAQFDLAQRAYKYPATQSQSARFGGTSCTDFQVGAAAPNIGTLPAPWEDLGNADQNRAIIRAIEGTEVNRPYVKVPDTYIRRRGPDGQSNPGSEPKQPIRFEPDLSLNAWYKDVIELYEYSFTQRQPNVYQGTLPSILQHWFQFEGERPNLPQTGPAPTGIPNPSVPPSPGILQEVESTTIPGLFCKEQYMCDDVDNGVLDSCITSALPGAVQAAGGRLLVSSTTRDVHAAGSEHYKNNAIDFSSSNPQLNAVQQYFKNQPRPPQIEVFGPAGDQYCIDKQGRANCAGHAHLHYSCNT
ncbi:MAG: hypothetical protein HY460_01985 [Parcubacteria group bacterium]|nr:hypothetical protein [Parcubacteria group bacterium]